MINHGAVSCAFSFPHPRYVLVPYFFYSFSHPTPLWILPEYSLYSPFSQLQASFSPTFLPCPRPLSPIVSHPFTLALFLLVTSCRGENEGQKRGEQGGRRMGWGGRGRMGERAGYGKIEPREWVWGGRKRSRKRGEWHLSHVIRFCILTALAVLIEMQCWYSWPRSNPTNHNSFSVFPHSFLRFSKVKRKAEVWLRLRAKWISLIWFSRW